VTGVRRYLLVLDMDLLAVDEQCDLGPISYLAGRQEHEPCEVVVLSLATGQPPASYGDADLRWDREDAPSAPARS
jgi:hypothetical protein